MTESERSLLELEWSRHAYKSAVQMRTNRKRRDRVLLFLAYGILLDSADGRPL